MAVDTKKEQERDELHRAIWAIADELRGAVDGWDFKNYVLGTMFYRYISENLAKLLNGIAGMNLGSVKDHDIDAFGDAYEYLMTMYASNAGKSGGEFFTPADVSELLTRLGTVGKTTINKVYDPACGSGSLLLKAEKILGKEAVRNGFFGQEINITTYNLCRINMFLHDIGLRDPRKSGSRRFMKDIRETERSIRPRRPFPMNGSIRTAL